MKKVWILCLIVAVVFASTGATCKSFWTGAQDTLCNPPPAVVTVVQVGISIAETAISMYVQGSQEYLDAAAALVSAQGLLNTGCILVTDLNKLKAWLQSNQALQAQAVMATKKMKATGKVSQPLNIEPLINWGK